MRPETFGRFYAPRERGAVTSINALCIRLSISPATTRPHARPPPEVAASTCTPPSPSPHATRSTSHNAAARRSGWALHAASLTPDRTTHGPFHRTLRQLSTASQAATKAAKKPTRRKRKKPEPKDEIAEPWRRQVKLLGLEKGLSQGQRAVLDMVVNQEKSIFFTGPAGTGKSLLLKRIIEGLTVKYLDEGSASVAVTASTGLAAFSIGGTTLHRFAGIGLGNAPTKRLISDIMKDREFKLQRWRDVKVLIIDEISMVDATLFDKLDTIARHVRMDDSPFGGIQLVITGDFFQLPPVLQGRDDGSPRFCFEAQAWQTAVKHTIGLTQIFRQKDPVFAGMLNEIREGHLSPTSIDVFKALSRPPKTLVDNGPEPAELFALRRDADAANTRRMHNIKKAVNTYHAIDGGIITDTATRQKLLADCTAPEVLQIKENAQVMLIKNINKTLVNGSLGRVVGFANKHTFIRGQWTTQPPDQTHHWRAKLQPSLLVDCEKDLPVFPVVRFQLPSGDARTELCEPAEWSVERWVREPWSHDGWDVEILATRTQVPLILAWALSIHKSQGQTLELVKVDLNRVFEMGQAYVALSRAKTMEGLQVLNFSPGKVTAHPRVKAFYAALEKT
ncbi:dna repair and recombination protein pif1 [Diplodia corticola]|uniref:ATP-dependent DNA helicase PIF1 n=1 Tax=Diplodia corticola TaxID=236234 RepID=A0A1J9QQT4_9PEZI|nr:dna repair and recombination protein pif1 [Diplodia corticola]OJD30801.1 dna repair and recombination protein pif1 [Diplodia corticola]